MDLKDQLIKLGSDNPELRDHIRPVLDRIAARPEEEVRDRVEDALKRVGISSSEHGYIEVDMGGREADVIVPLKFDVSDEGRLWDLYRQSDNDGQLSQEQMDEDLMRARRDDLPYRNELAPDMVRSKGVILDLESRNSGKDLSLRGVVDL
jgi:hypothetical protein